MNLAGVSLRDLEYVVAVADHGSFVRAAETCNVSQPSLSAQIRKLESGLGLTIFERTTRRVLVTTRGQTFIAQARRVLAEARLLLTISPPDGQKFGGTLRLAAIATLGPYFFPRVLRALRAEYAETSLILGEGFTADLVRKLSDGELDAALLSLPLPDAALVAAPLFPEPFYLACPRGHRVTLPEGPGWEGLDPSERLLLEDGHCLREQALAACNGASSSQFHATSLETLKYMVAAGQGCTLIPALAVTPMEGVSYLPLRGDAYSRSIALTWRRSDPRHQDFVQLARFLQSQISEASLAVKGLSSATLMKSMPLQSRAARERIVSDTAPRVAHTR